MALSDFKFIGMDPPVPWALHRRGLCLATDLFHHRIERTLWPKLLAILILAAFKEPLAGTWWPPACRPRDVSMPPRRPPHAALIFAAIIWVANGGTKRQYPSSSGDWLAVFLVAHPVANCRRWFRSGPEAGLCPWPKMDGQ